jgi:hypothetical protein
MTNNAAFQVLSVTALVVLNVKRAIRPAMRPLHSSALYHNAE